MNRRLSIFIGIQFAAIALVAAILYIFPGAGLLTMLIKYLGVWAVTVFAYKQLCPCNIGGFYSMLVMWTMLAVGVTINIWYFTTYSGGTVYSPVLVNDDASTAWTQMTTVLSGTESDVSLARRGYGSLLAMLCGRNTPSIATLLCFNMLATMIAVVLTGAATAAMLRRAGEIPESKLARAACTAMIMTGGVSYFLTTGTILIKDAFCCLAMATVLYALFGVRGSAVKWTLLVASAFLAMLIRPNMLVFIALASIFSLYSGRRYDILPTIAFCIVLAGVYIWQSHSGQASAVIDTNDGTTSFWLGRNNGTTRLEAYSTIGGGYENLPILRKIVLLPFTLSVQFLTPLPWAFTRDAVFGPALSWAHFSLPWYALGGLLFYFLFFRLRRSPRNVQAAFAFALAAWAMTAFITGGTVSRYCLPWLPFLVPAAVWLFSSGQTSARSFRIWMWSYAALLAIGLAIVFTALHIYSPGGWEAI